MTQERRYDEDEVTEILERATSAERPGSQRALAGSPSGLTLSQLQDIGAEVGIPADRIADAVYAVANRPVGAPSQTFLGAPRSVSRVVPLNRALDDDEWTRLVADLRETFGAVGRIQTHGTLRTWTNGNLQVHVEPAGDRYRVRMQTLRGDAFARAGMGVITLGAGTITALASALGGIELGDLVIGGALMTAGVAQLAWLRVLISRWAGARARQMDAVAARLNESLRLRGG